MSTRVAGPERSMRKVPKQGRSRATVDVIVEAAARILGDEGWSSFTTNRVAEVAGVSIGSLYQYFPDKHSLVSAVRQLHLDDCLNAVRSAYAPEVSHDEIVARLVLAMLAAHRLRPGLHRVLLDEAPSADAFRDPHSDFETAYIGRYVELVARYHGRAPCKSDRMVGQLISDVLDGAIHNAARRGTIADPALQIELVRMITLYLDSLPSAPRVTASTL